jgi:Gpi18-like mannosyltransferase
MLSQLSKKEIKQIVATGFFMLFNFLFIWFFWKKVVLLAIILFALAVLEMAIIRSRKLVAVFILAAIGAATFESISIHLGIWSYNMPMVFNIPLWLIPGWGNAAIIVVTFYKLMSKIEWLEKNS